MKDGGRLDRLLTPERRRFVKFGLVGATGVLVNLAFVAIGQALFTDLAAREDLSSGLGILVSMLTNFLLNDAWTWGDRQKGARKRDFAWRIGAYYLGAAIAAAVQFGVSALLRDLFTMNIYLAQLGGIAVGTVINYVINNRLVFKDRGERPPT